MDNADNIDLLTSFKKLVAENRSLQSRLADYEKLIQSRDREIDMLQSMLSEANEHRSSVDNQLTELKELKQFINGLRGGIANPYETEGNAQQKGGVGVNAQLEDLKQAYAQLQAQLTDLQSQLLDMNNKNLQLQLQASRVAELESLVANMEFDRDGSQAE